LFFDQLQIAGQDASAKAGKIKSDLFYVKNLNLAK